MSIDAAITDTGTELRGFNRIPAALIFLGAAAACSFAGEFDTPKWVDGIAVAVFLVGLLVNSTHWVNRKSGKIALVLGAAALFLWLGTAESGPSFFLDGMLRFNGVIVLLVMLPLFRHVFTQSRLDRDVISLLSGVTCRMRMTALLLSSWITACGLSFGTIGVLGASLSGRSVPDTAVPGTIMRGIVLSMLLGPTTGSVAVVMATYPGVSWAQALTLGFPLALVGLCLACFQRGRMALDEPEEKNDCPSGNAGGSHGLLLLFGALALSLTMSSHLLLGLSLLGSISLAAIGTTAFWFTFVTPIGLGETISKVDGHLQATWCQLSPEIALFLACGLLSSALQLDEYRNTVVQIGGMLDGTAWLGLAAIVLGIPFLTVAGIHPMVPFSVLSAAVTSSGLELTAPGFYTMWIVMFMLSMLLSPVSVLNVTTANNFNVCPWSLGVRTHAAFALVFGGACVVFLRLFCSL